MHKRDNELLTNICADFNGHRFVGREERTHNSTYPKGGVSRFGDTFVQAESSVLHMKFSGKNPALRVAAKRWWQYYRDAIINRTFPALHGLLPAALVSFDQALNGARFQSKCIKLHQ